MKLRSIVFFLLFSTYAFAQKTEIRNVSEFTEISLGSSGHLYLTQGNETKVELRASESTLEKIKTEVRGGRLYIGTKDNSWFSWSSDDFDVYITTPRIEGLSVSGSGTIETKNKIKTGGIDLSVSGSGRLYVSIDASNVDASISGSGKINVEGTGKKLSVSISGSGKLNGEELEVISCKAVISGSGSCEIHVTEEIDARISGSGSVYYKGSPDRVNSSSSGSGKVRKM